MISQNPSYEITMLIYSQDWSPEQTARWSNLINWTLCWEAKVELSAGALNAYDSLDLLQR